MTGLLFYLKIDLEAAHTALGYVTSREADMFKIENELGKLNIEKNAVGRIVSESISLYDGEVFLTNKKGKPLKLENSSGMLDHSPDMEIFVKDGVLNIEFYILLKFGTSIKETTGRIFDNISSDVNAILGIDNIKMKITVTGMYIKDIKNIAKRSIEVLR